MDSDPEEKILHNNTALLSASLRSVLLILSGTSCGPEFDSLRLHQLAGATGFDVMGNVSGGIRQATTYRPARGGRKPVTGRTARTISAKNKVVTMPRVNAPVQYAFAA